MVQIVAYIKEPQIGACSDSRRRNADRRDAASFNSFATINVSKLNTAANHILTLHKFLQKRAWWTARLLLDGPAIVEQIARLGTGTFLSD